MNYTVSATLLTKHNKSKDARVHRNFKDMPNPGGNNSEVKRYYVELDSGPFYLVPNDDTPSSTTSEAEDGFFSGKNLCYFSSFVHGVTFAGNIRWHEQLGKILQALLPEKGDVIPAMAYNSQSFERGYFAGIPFQRDDVFSMLEDKSKKEDLTVSVKKFLQVSNTLIFQVEHTDGTNRSLDGSENLKLKLVRSLTDVHPAFRSHETNSVYHSIQRCYDVLNEYQSREEVKELMEICDGYIKEAADWKESLPLKQKNPVIVIEGLDATGKTTLTKNLGKDLNATVLKSPAECICHLRSKFDSSPQLLRRAFYSLGNYAFAKMVHDAAKDGVVIVDRFWNSTAAYAIATDVGAGGPECLPPNGHWVYSWPSDLLKPDAVFLLTISDEERRRRLKSRGTVKTDEEIRLEASSPFRQRLEETYLRMENPSPLQIDASGTVDDVLSKTLENLKSLKLIV